MDRDRPGKSCDLHITRILPLHSSHSSCVLDPEVASTQEAQPMGWSSSASLCSGRISTWDKCWKKGVVRALRSAKTFRTDSAVHVRLCPSDPPTAARSRKRRPTYVGSCTLTPSGIQHRIGS